MSDELEAICRKSVPLEASEETIEESTMSALDDVRTYTIHWMARCELLEKQLIEARTATINALALTGVVTDKAPEEKEPLDIIRNKIR